MVLPWSVVVAALLVVVGLAKPQFSETVTKHKTRLLSTNFA
jgi:hypothetical protein